jgi:transcription initiation factor IIE alpha subunit
MMVPDLYDSTLVYNSEEKDVDMAGEVECPVCGERVFPGLTDESLDAALDSAIEAPFDCPECDTDLLFLIERLPTEEIGLGISVVRVGE